MENNLCYNCSSQGFHQHYGKENYIRNNIFALNGGGQVRIRRKEEHISAFFENNIIVADKSLLYASVNKGKFVDNNNLYWDYTLRRCVISSKNETMKVKQLLPVVAMRWNGNYQQAKFADPLFVDRKGRDFTLAKNSPALKCGFVPWDYQAAGTITSFA